MESIKNSIENEVWSTSAGPTKKLINAFRTVDNVALIFSVNESRSFQGFALIQGEPDPNYKKEFFTNDNSTSIQFADNWIVRCEYPFAEMYGLPNNPMNENMPIKQSKNGQELPFKLGNYLCHLIYNYKDPSTKIINELDSITSKAGGGSYQ